MHFHTHVVGAIDKHFDRVDALPSQLAHRLREIPVAGYRKIIHVEARDRTIFRWVTDFIPTPDRVQKKGIIIGISKYLHF